MGDYQARFCERLRVKLPLPTRRLSRYSRKERQILLKQQSLTNQVVLKLHIIKPKIIF